MTGPEHYREAERLTERADDVMDAEYGIYASMGTQERIQRRTAYLAEAQVHATLALAAATALVREGVGGTLPAGDRAAWFNAASEHNTTSRKAAAA